MTLIEPQNNPPDAEDETLECGGDGKSKVNLLVTTALCFRPAPAGRASVLRRAVVRRDVSTVFGLEGDGGSCWRLNCLLGLSRET